MTSYDETWPTGAEEAAVLPENPPVRRRPRLGLAISIVAVIALGIGIYGGIRERAAAEVTLSHVTNMSAVPFVAVIQPQSGAPEEQLVLPGSTQPFTDTPIYARTSGYLRRWYFDIGARVRRGDLLAEIDTPEVGEQLLKARADLATAEANLKLAGITAQRNEDLLKTRSVATQDRDNAVGAYAADKAIVASNQADVARLERLQSYEKIYAPFDGTITARNTDIGALIDAGANSAARELFHLSATDKLRIFVAVPEAWSRATRPGAKVGVTLEEFPGEVFQGSLVRTANTINPTSLTLLAEVDVDNAGNRLLPGAYVTVHLSLPNETRSVTVPSNTLIFRKEGLRVAVLRDGRAQLVPVTIGRDYGSRVEVVSGLQASDSVILDPSDSLISGTAVEVTAPQRIGSAQ